ncbi:MAG: hypothetical protein FJX75_27780, partial [Armatimonadetes bacterium]|nr:hypothetical protein [Armatimonadota bacterium]
APDADPKDKTFPESGWLLQPDGSRIEGWPGTQMINLTKPEVIDWLAARSVASVREKGFDGTFIDCMGSNFDWWACNIESGKPCEIDADRDGKADDRQRLDALWTAAKTDLSRQVREALGPDVPFMTNQAGEWGFPTMNGILLEDWLDYVLDGSMDWDSVMQAYLHWMQEPHRPTLTTIVSSSGVQPPFDPWRTLNEAGRTALLEHGRNLLPRMRFGLATTLMGDGYFAYDLHTRWRGQRWWYPEYDAPLGYPNGPAAKQPDGTWRREFEGGTVIVNPTPFDAPVAFEQRHEDVSSGKVDTAFVIPPRDGRILLPSDKALAPGSIPDPQPLFSVAGTEPVVERGEQILCRLDGLAAVFDAQGRLVRLTDGSHTLLEQARPFVVKDDRWQDFAYTGRAHRILPDGALEFTGRRTDGAMALAYVQTVKIEGRSLSIAYGWRAETDLHVHMWRHQTDFPVAAYGGGSFEAGQGMVTLPVDRAPQPGLASSLRRITLKPPTGPAITVEISGDAGLVDERHYGVQAFRLGHYPASGDLKAGQTWKVGVRIAVE